MALRGMTALAVLVSAAVHLWLWYDGFADIEVIGPLFLLNAAAGAAIAALLVTWRHWLPLLAAIGFGAATLGAFILSTTVGLFGVNERWAGWAVWTAAVSEAVAVVAGVAALLAERRSGVELEQRAPRRRAHLD